MAPSRSPGLIRFSLHIISPSSWRQYFLVVVEEIVNESRKMMRFLIVVCALVAVAAEKDSAYYPDGMENPNVDDKMYWADATNVLEDIAQFDALYITHHGCA
jgi:hypothetical protein